MKHLALSVLLSLVLVGCAEEEEAAVAPPADIGAGKAIAETQCAGCHGLDGRGTAPGIPNMAAQADGYLIESLQAYKEGKRMHAALRDMTTQLSDADIRNVVGYYASLPPLEAAAAPKPEDVLSPYEKGKAAAGACAQCHGEDGNSRTAGTPTVAGQQPVYFVSAVRAYLDGRRRLIGKEMMRELGKADLESLALYYASQTPAKREAPAVGDPAAGEPLSARCGGCHGAHGVSNDSATPSLAGQDPQYLAGAIKAYRDRSRRHDAMLANNTDKEIEDLAAFYAVQESQAVESTRVTVQDLAAKCDRCHGPDVENPTMAIPKISGQDRDYLIKALRAYHDGKRGSSMMHRMSLPYSEAIMESVASHYASQPAK
jgi:cytochrome c553